MPSSPDIANDAAATFAAYPELVTKIDAGTTVPDAELDQWIGATYPNFVDACVTQINEVFTGQRSISGRLRVANAPASGFATGCDNIVIGDGSGGYGLTGFTSLTSAFCIAQRTSRDSSENYISFDANSRRVVILAARDINTNAAVQVQHDGTDGQLCPTFAFQSTDLGTNTQRWRDLFIKGQAYIAPAAAPATPSSGAVLYVDSATGDLVVKFSTGTTTVLASP